MTEPILLPAPVHYELILQILEKRTIQAVEKNSFQYKQIQDLMITMRKAIALQKQLEASCEKANLPTEYRWSLNEINQAD